jgi:hypothetical protein
MDFRRAPRSLLEAGALAGGLAVLLHWAAFELGRGAFGPGSGLPAVIAGLGLLSTGLGTLAVAVGPLSRTGGRLLGGALLAVLLGAVVGGLLTGEELLRAGAVAGPLYAAVGLYALALAVTMALRPDAAHWLALPLALFEVFVAVLGFLTDSSWLGTLAALAAVVTLWAFRTPYPRNEPTTESPGRETEAHS